MNTRTLDLRDAEAPWLETPSAAGPLFAALAAPIPPPQRGGAPCLSEEQVGTLSRELFGGRPYRPLSPDTCQAGSWTVALVSIATGELELYPFRCKSWRCKRCAPMVNQRDAVRIEDALGRRARTELLFLTLTFDQRRLTARVRRRRPDLSEEQAAELARKLAWRQCGRAWKRLRDRLAHHYGATFYVANHRPKGKRRKAWLARRRKARIDYVQTWEQHRSGWPHVHAVVWGPEIARDVRRRGFYAGVDKRGDARDVWRWTRQVLVPHAIRSGFGRIADVEFPRKNEAALAGYLVKLAGELTGSHRKDQTPLEAPRSFRRLRATPKWLPRLREGAGRFTGAVLGAPVEFVARALELGAETLEHAGNLARAIMQSLPGTDFTQPIPETRDGPSLRADLRLEWERG